MTKPDTKNFIQLNILIVRDCFLAESSSYQIPKEQLKDLIEFIENLNKKVRG